MGAGAALAEGPILPGAGAGGDWQPCGGGAERQLSAEGVRLCSLSLSPAPSAISPSPSAAVTHLPRPGGQGVVGPTARAASWPAASPALHGALRPSSCFLIVDVFSTLAGVLFHEVGVHYSPPCPSPGVGGSRCSEVTLHWQAVGQSPWWLAAVKSSSPSPAHGPRPVLSCPELIRLHRNNCELSPFPATCPQAWGGAGGALLRAQWLLNRKSCSRQVFLCFVDMLIKL